MFFSVEFGLGKEVEPRFFNAECALGTLLRAIRDDALEIVGNQIDAKLAEYKREIPRLEQEISDLQQQQGAAAASPKAGKAGAAKASDPKTDDRKSELQRMKTNVPKLEELKPLLGKIGKVDLSYTESAAGRLNLDFDAYSLAVNSGLQPKTRTWLVGLVEGGEPVLMKWEL